MSKLSSEETQNILTFFNDAYLSYLSENSIHTWESFTANPAARASQLSEILGIVSAKILPVIQNIIASGSVHDTLKLAEATAMSESIAKQHDEERKDNKEKEQTALALVLSKSEEEHRQEELRKKEESETQIAIAQAESIASLTNYEEDEALNLATQLSLMGVGAAEDIEST